METVLIAGGSGLVGSHLRQILIDSGYRVLVLTRNAGLAASTEDYVLWDVPNDVIDHEAQSADHIINLAGAGIADRRWTHNRKKEIIESRTRTTKLLIRYCRDHDVRLRSFINASAMGYYGDCGERMMSEDDEGSTSDFLSKVCQLWEEAAHDATDIADSVTLLRISTVLSTRGGALPKMTSSIPFGIAPYLGDGQQYISWIHIEDLCRMISFFLQASHSFEVYNAATDRSMTNKSFTKSLVKSINRHALLSPVPEIALKLAMGEMSRVVLNSCRLNTEKLEKTGFENKFNDLVVAVRDLKTRKI